MKAIDLREEQLIELDILKEFAKFCTEHDLRYYLDSGTLIGAIRHQGFIPWDDDIDVCLLRSDYEKFKALMIKNNCMLNDYLRLELEKDSMYPYLKIVDIRTLLIEYPDTNPLRTSVYIDIFPKDGLKSPGRTEKKRADKVQKYILRSWLSTFTVERLKRTGRISDTILAYIIKLTNYNPEKYKKRAIALAQKYSKEACPFVSSIVCSGLKGIVPKTCFEKQVNVLFEGETFKAPIGYDEYLHSLYSGDYMVLPPPEKRIAHKTEVYWKENKNYAIMEHHI